MSGVLVERDGGVARVWLDRPERRNAFDAAMIAGLRETFTSLAEDATLRAVVLAGRGAAFCAGGDLEWMRASGALPTRRTSPTPSASRPCSRPSTAAPCR